MKIYCRMETGLGKTNIEDRILVENTILAGGIYVNELPLGASPFVVAVADGVGGNKAGNVAAHMAVEGLSSLHIPIAAQEETLKQIICEVNQKIIENSKWTSDYHNMATTLTGICHIGGKWILFHVGNTRVYVWKDAYLTQLTTDHSWAKEMELVGLSEDEIRSSGRATEITSCLGNGNAATANKLQVFDVTKEIDSPHMLLLTTDGVHEYIPADILEQSLHSIDDVNLYLEQAMRFARDNGSHDDLSMIILDFTP